MELINNNTNFKLTNLKFTKCHFMSGEIYNGCPIKTSVEIKFDNYSLQTNKDVATLCIVHTYFLGTEEQTNFQQYELENSENIIKSLEQIDFKNLKNNYFSDEPSQRFSHWELEYNYYFKITGTFDNEIDEIKEIKKILNFEQIEKEELEKVDAKFKNTRFAISIKDAIENFMYKMQTALDIETGLLNDTITFDIENENEFIKLTEGLKKLYNISNDELKFNNIEQMKQFLIDWLKKIEEVNKLVDEEIEKYNMAVKNNLPTEDQTAILNKIKKIRGILIEEDLLNENKKERSNEMNDELKVNDNNQFNSEETQQEFSNYIDEINEYNRKIKNGEETDVNPGDLLNKYREKFYDEELENKMKEIDNQKENFKFENNETNEMLNKIDQKILELDEEYKD